MTHTYNITGMTCGGCISKVKNELLKLGDINTAEITLKSPHAILTLQKHIAVSVLQTALCKAGNFNITEAAGDQAADRRSSWVRCVLQDRGDESTADRGRVVNRCHRELQIRR